MGKIKDVIIDIQYLWCDGFEPQSIADQLNIPIEWVYSVINEIESGCCEESEWVWM